MKARHLVFAVILLTAGCTSKSNQTQSFQSSGINPQELSYEHLDLSKNSPDGLPKFKLIAVITGALIQLGPKGQVITIPSQKNQGYVQYPSPANFNILGERTKDGPLELTKNGATSVVPPGSFIDDDGNLKQTIDDQPIQILVEGKKIGIIPLRTFTSGYRYYASKQAIFGRKAKEEGIRKLMDLEGQIVNFEIQSNDLVILETLSNYEMKVTKLSPGSDPKILIRSNNSLIGNIRHLDDQGRLTVKRGYDVGILESDGKIHMTPDGTHDLMYFKHKQDDFMVGFTSITTKEFGQRDITPVMWNKQSKPVPLATLLGEDGPQIIGLHDLYFAKIISNSDGYIAFEMSGQPLSTPGNSTITTYLIKAID